MNMEKVTEAITDRRIIAFFEGSSNMTLATSFENVPYCAHCFYAFDAKKGILVFKSAPDTNHIRQAVMNPMVAGTIAPDKLVKSAIRGIQFTGRFTAPEGEQLADAKKIYYGKYPFAKVIAGSCFTVELAALKMTDNTLGFGKKIEWKRTP